MYGFEPTDEQNMLIDAVRRYAEKDLRGAGHDADESGKFPPGLIEKGWELGVLQASVPEAYGGFGERSALTGVLAAEEMAWGDMAAALAVMTPATYAVPLLLAGTEEQKRSLLPPVIEGEWQPYTAAFIEPDFDFYPGEMRTQATPSSGGYRLAGTKAMVPFADQARSLIVYAACEGQTQAFVVPAQAAGLRVGEREALLGLGALPLFRVQLDGRRGAGGQPPRRRRKATIRNRCWRPPPWPSPGWPWGSAEPPTSMHSPTPKTGSCSEPRWRRSSRSPSA